MKFLVLCVSAVAAVPWGAAPAEQKSCTDPRLRGDFCDAPQQQMFYYNPQLGVCQPFMYNGCNGNGNRFNSAKECQDYCINGGGAQMQKDAPGMNENVEMAAACRADYDASQLTVTRCTAGQQCPIGHQCNNGFCCPQPNYLCLLNYDSGKFSVGGEKSDRYFFTKDYNTCMRFSYYGSLGNANNFPNYNACMRTCGAMRA